MPTPDDDGRLELSHRAWQHVGGSSGPWVWKLRRCLAYNRLAHIAPELGMKLRELDCSCNKLQAPAKIERSPTPGLKCNGNSWNTSQTRSASASSSRRSFAARISSWRCRARWERARSSVLLAQNSCWPCARRRSRTCRLVRAHQPRGQPATRYDPQENRDYGADLPGPATASRQRGREPVRLSCIDTLKGISRGATGGTANCAGIEESRRGHLSIAQPPDGHRQVPSSTVASQDQEWRISGGNGDLQWGSYCGVADDRPQPVGFGRARRAALNAWAGSRARRTRPQLCCLAAVVASRHSSRGRGWARRRPCRRAWPRWRRSPIRPLQ